MDDLFELTEKAQEYLNSGILAPESISKEIKNKINHSGYIGIAQINTGCGNLEFNAKKISNYIKFSECIGLDAVVFPEYSLTGSPLEDIIRRHPIIIKENKKWLEGIAKITKNTVALVGFIDEYNNEYYNSVAVLQYGKIQECIRKPITNKAYNIQKNEENMNYSGILYNEYGITLGYDYICNNELSEIKTLVDKKPKILINSSALVQNLHNKFIKTELLSFISAKYNIPIVFANQTGANDNYIYDGLSCVYNSKGDLIARAKFMEEQLLIANPYLNTGKIYPLPSGFKEALQTQNNFSLDYTNDLERTYKTLRLGISDYFKKCGFKRAVLGLSGGLDSTVCAVLLADSIGKENVYGISMPSEITSNESKSDAEKLANNLGIHFAEAPIKPIVKTTTDCFNILFEKMEKEWGKYYDKTIGIFNNNMPEGWVNFTQDNIQARSRAMYLWGISNEFASCIPIATSDKSEAYMGYATINGDMSGGFAPIADITKTKLFALARWMNENRETKNVIPEVIILKSPGAELAIDKKTGKPLKAEDALMPYEFLDEIIWRIENRQEAYNEMLNSAFVYEKKHNISREQKIEWLDKFYRRMSTAFYKWSIMPPYVIAEQHSINSGDYNQPITSVGINYKGVSENYITETLN